ncbi:MAG: GNAT family N-acetyltransferase [Rhodobacteraceae bacterium]|nr:GNAT family N-acetyltransferase [Paracoccaceae bacterium]
MIKLPNDTERLRFREVTLDDCLLYFQLLNQEDYIRFIGDKNIQNLDDAETYIDTNQKPSYRINGFGSYILVRKEDGKPLGFCGLYQRDGFDVPDLGYALLSEHHGQGYAREAALGVLKHAETHLGLNEICAIVLPGNARSSHLLDAIGFTWSHNRSFPGTDETVEIYKRSSQIQAEK